MSVIEVIERVGLENVRVQFLSECTTHAKQKKHGVEISFVTSHPSCADLINPDDPNQIGMIVWIPRDKLPKELLKK